MCKEYENCTSCPQCGSRHTGLAGFDDSNTLLAHRVCKRCGMRWDSAFSGFSTGIMDDLEAFAVNFSDEELRMFHPLSRKADIRLLSCPDSSFI